MYERPLGLVMACVAGVGVAWTCALVSQLPHMQALALVFTLLAVCRVALCCWYWPILERFGQAALHRAICLVALTYALLVGFVGLSVLLFGPGDSLQMLGVAFAMVFASAIAMRGASQPRLVLWQSALALMPLFFGSLYVASPATLVLAAMLPALAVAIRSLTLAVHTSLTEQMTIAQNYRQLSAELRHQASHDPLTGLYNRDGLHSALGEWIAQSRAGETIALMWLDLHRLREVNETLGYGAGDALLREMARRLRKQAGRRSVVGRFASDEFVIAIPVSSRRDAKHLVAHISAELLRPMRIDDCMVESGTSIGIAILNEDADTLDSLMQAADLALLQAKSSGSQQVCFFNREMTDKRRKRKQIEADLREALGKDGLSICYQPLVDLETGQIRSFEALVRWKHPQKGDMSPEEFISVAEDTGLIISLGNWVAAHAMREAAKWPRHVSLAVNLSPIQIRAQGAALGILHALKESGLEPSRLELEVTENLFLHDDETTLRLMEQLGEAGVRFSLDDFGTGYSSLNYIHKYPFGTIKIDRSFVSGLNAADARCHAIIRAVAQMGASLGMEIVAEGIETAAQLRRVREAGCTLGQGFHFSAALDARQAAQLLRQQGHQIAYGDTHPSGQIFGRPAPGIGAHQQRRAGSCPKGHNCSTQSLALRSSFEA